MNELGWDLYSFDHEDANGQYEFDFSYADALTICDRYIFFRFMAKHYAKEQGLIATMMPKPFADKTGTGRAFQHVAPRSRQRAQCLRLRPRTIRAGSGSPTLGYHFIGGILRHGRALCAAFAPTVNSYKRLVRQGAMCLLLLGAGVQLLWLEQPHQFGARAHGRRALRIAQRRWRGQSLPRRHACARGRARRRARRRSIPARPMKTISTTISDAERRGREHRLPAADLAGGRRGLRRRSLDREDPRQGAAR